MSELVEIILQAVDNASGIFQGVEDSANSMADDITGSVEGLTGDFEEMESTVDDFGESVANVDGSTLDELSDSLNGMPFDDAATSADNLEQEILEADDAIQSLDADLGIVNSSMLLQLGEQVGQIGDKAEGMAQEMNTAAISVGQLATQTGVAEPEMVSLINTISNATFPNDEAMMYVKALDQMGVSTENFGKSATDMDRINDALGLGAPKVTALSNEMAVLGVDMNNVSSSFNALAYANANTIGGMDNYSRFLTKYSADFADLGLNIDQASVVIAAATQKFGGGKAALTGLSNALKESGGDAKALEEALDMEAGSIENATSITGEYEGQLLDLASEEAEHKTLVDQLGAAWEDLSLSLSPVLGPLTSIIGLIGSVGSFGLQVSGLRSLITLIREFNAVQTITNLLEGEGAIARIASAIGITTEAAAAEGATVAFGGLAIAEAAALWPILAIAAAIVGLIVVVYEVGKAFGWWSDVGGMIDAIWDGINRLWSAFINHPDVQAAISAISNALQILWGYLQQAGQAVMDFFGINEEGNFDIVRALIDGIGNAWNNVKTAVMSVYNTVSGVISAIWAVISPFVFQIIGFVQNIISAIDAFKTGQMDLPTFIMTILTQLWNIFTTVVSGIVALISKFGSQLLQYGIRAGRNLVNGVINWLRQLPGRVYSALLNVVSRITSAIQSWINAAKKKVSDLIRDVTSPFSGVASAISNALSGVVEAVTAPFREAWNTVEPYVKKIKEGIDLVGDITGFWGGETVAYGGETAVDVASNKEFNITTGEYTVKDEPIEINQTVTLDLINVPAHIDTATLIEMLKDKRVLQSLTSNGDFQTLDARVKQKMNLKGVRARGR